MTIEFGQLPELRSLVLRLGSEGLWAVAALERVMTGVETLDEAFGVGLSAAGRHAAKVRRDEFLSWLGQRLAPEPDLPVRAHALHKALERYRTHAFVADQTRTGDHPAFKNLERALLWMVFTQGIQVPRSTKQLLRILRDTSRIECLRSQAMMPTNH